MQMKSSQPDVWISAMQSLQEQFIEGIRAAAPDDYKLTQEETTKD